MKSRILFAALFVVSGILIGCQGTEGAAAANQSSQQQATPPPPASSPGGGAASGGGAMTAGPPHDGPAPDMNQITGSALKKGN